MRSDQASSERHRRAAGFTLVELMITLVVLGILVSMAIPNFLRAAERARTGSCRSNQRNLMVAAALYSADENFLDGVVNSALLHERGYATDAVCGCPSNMIEAFGDYDVEITAGRIVWTTCLVKGAEHELVL